MSLARRFYDLIHDSLSTAVDKASDPEDKIRAVMHNIKDSEAGIREATAGPIAEYNRLLEKRNTIQAKVTDLETKLQAAVKAGNEDVKRIRAGQLLDGRKELADIQSRLVVAEERANEAKERYEDWKRRTGEAQAKAVSALDDNQRAQAQERFNTAMQSIDSASLTSELTSATEAIAGRAARADAQASLDEDPDEKILRQAAKDSRKSDIDELLKSMEPEVAGSTAANG